MKKKEPNIHPVWYFFDVSSHTIYFNTSPVSKKYSNIKESVNKRIYFCIDEINPPYKEVRGKGNVKIHNDVKFNVFIGEKKWSNTLAILTIPYLNPYEIR